MENRNSVLVKNMIFLGMFIIASKGISYFLLPIFTSYMSTADYGTADLLVSTVNLLYPLTALGMGSAILRFTISDEVGRKIVVTTALRIIFITNIFLLLAIPFIIHFTGQSNYIWFVPLEIFITNLTTVMVAVCEGIGKTNIIVLQSAVKGGVLFVSAIVTLKFLKMGIAGYIISYLIADVVSLIFFAVLIRFHKYIERHLDKQTWKRYRNKMLNYGVPLVPNSMSAWVVQMSDRYMVTFWHGTSLNGLYAVAYKIPSIIKVFSSAFINAWQINVISESDKRDSKNYFDLVKNLYSASCFLVAALIMVTVRLLAGILFAKEFYEAWRYVPFLVFGATLDLITEYLGTYFYAKDRTNRLFFSTLFGATINILLNVVFIPHYGAWGATIATVISYCALYIYRGLDIHRQMNYRTFSKRDLFGFLLIFATCVAYFVSAVYGQIISCVAAAMMMILFRKEIIIILNIVKKLWRTIK